MILSNISTDLDYSIDNMLKIKHLDDTHRLNKLLDMVFDRSGLAKTSANISPYFWDEAFYNLDKLPYYKDFSDDTKFEILQALSRSFLIEATYIESFGFSFASKIMMLSDSVEEKSIYALFVADEARHLRQVLKFVNFDLNDAYKNDPFICLLAEIINTGNYLSLIFLLQSFLEGTGIHHYKHLKDHCINSDFVNCLGNILKDESHHHAAGCIIVDASEFSNAAIDYIYDAICQLVTYVQWPHRTVAIMETVLGHFSKVQKQKVLESIGYQQEMQMKLDRFKSLIYKHSPKQLIERLDNVNIFKPLGIKHHMGSA